MPELQHLREEQLEDLKILYPWYKEEVFRRREQMMRLTAFASAFLVLLLVTMLAVPTLPARPRPDFTAALFAITGVAPTHHEAVDPARINTRIEINILIYLMLCIA